MLKLVVPDFMGHDGLDFIHGHALDQSIVEHDSLGLAESGEIGVRVLAAFGGIHYEQSVGGESGLGQHGLEPCLEIPVLKWLELVEQRGDELGVNDVGYEHEDHQHHRDDCPPVGRTANKQDR